VAAQGAQAIGMREKGKRGRHLVWEPGSILVREILSTVAVA